VYSKMYVQEAVYVRNEVPLCCFFLKHGHVVAGVERNIRADRGVARYVPCAVCSACRAIRRCRSGSAGAAVCAMLVCAMLARYEGGGFYVVLSWLGGERAAGYTRRTVQRCAFSKRGVPTAKTVSSSSRAGSVVVPNQVTRCPQIVSKRYSKRCPSQWRTN